MSKTRKNMGQICIILQKFITKKKTEIDDLNLDIIERHLFHPS